MQSIDFTNLTSTLGGHAAKQRRIGNKRNNSKFGLKEYRDHMVKYYSGIGGRTSARGLELSQTYQVMQNHNQTNRDGLSPNKSIKPETTASNIDKLSNQYEASDKVSVTQQRAYNNAKRL